MTDQTPTDPFVLGLAALAATLHEPKRAQRLLDLTGIGTDELKRRASDATLLAAVISFLEAHEPDLFAVCDELGLKPSQLVAARQMLEGQVG